MSAGPRDWRGARQARATERQTVRDTHPGRIVASPRIAVDKGSEEPLYQQIYESVRDGIMIGDWKPGDRLPSIRALAAALDIANNTVSTAYRQLTAEGFVESRRGSGYVVCNTLSDALNFSFARQAVKVAPPHEDKRKAYACDFGYGDLCSGAFPLEEWRKLVQSVLTKENAEQLCRYGNSRGEWGLRQRIAELLAKTRGVACTPNQIVITNGTQASVSLVLSLVDGAGPVAMEDPGFSPVRNVIRSERRAIEPLRTDCGADAFLDDVHASKAKLAYLTPTHQFPLGACMSQRVRAQVLLEARAKNAYLIEDDYDCDLRYNVQPVPPLKAIDQQDRVIYLGSFSKVVSPALRMGYVVLPHALLGRYAELFRESHCGVPWLEQAVLERFIASGECARHIRRMTRAYRRRYELLRSSLEEAFGTRIEIHGVAAGLFMVVEVKNRMDERTLVSTADKAGVRVTGASGYWMRAQDAPSNHVLLGFSAADEQAIRAGVPRLREAWFPQGNAGSSSEDAHVMR